MYLNYVLSRNFVVGHHVDLEEWVYAVFGLHLYNGLGQIPIVNVEVFQYVPPAL